MSPMADVHRTIGGGKVFWDPSHSNWVWLEVPEYKKGEFKPGTIVPAWTMVAECEGQQQVPILPN